MRKWSLAMNVGAIAVVVLLVSSVAAQAPKPRYGRWNDIIVNNGVNEIRKMTADRRGAATR